MLGGALIAAGGVIQGIVVGFPRLLRVGLQPVDCYAVDDFPLLIARLILLGIVPLAAPR